MHYLISQVIHYLWLCFFQCDQSILFLKILEILKNNMFRTTVDNITVYNIMYIPFC